MLLVYPLIHAKVFFWFSFLFVLGSCISADLCFTSYCFVSPINHIVFDLETVSISPVAILRFSTTV